MKRLIFVVLMITFSVSWARWEISGTTDDGITTYYHDKSTIRKNGAVAKMWTIQDYLFVQNDEMGKFKSLKSLFLFHCKEETMAVIAAGAYSGSMGNGDVVASFSKKENQIDWSPIFPNSFGETQWKIACGKK